MQNKKITSDAEKACQAILDKKGSNIIVIDVRGVSSCTDFCIVAQGTVERHTIALAKHVIDALKKQGVSPAHQEGLCDGDWIVLDYVDFMVHLFTPELREYYSLEEVWKEGTVVLGCW